MEDEVFHIDEFLNIVNGLKTIIKQDRYSIDSIKDLKNDFPEEIIKLEETLLN